jgi:hypothetical protein
VRLGFFAAYQEFHGSTHSAETHQQDSLRNTPFALGVKRLSWWHAGRTLDLVSMQKFHLFLVFREIASANAIGAMDRVDQSLSVAREPAEKSGVLGKH